MQIMPSTGHLIAEITDDREFNAGDLNDPVLSIGYGVRYLGLLMDRYDHIYPLAAASYNGGPHNVSSWLRGTGSDMPMDLFVEHIPFRETRNYVRRVSQAYAGYIDRYSDEGAYLALPPHSLGNHPEIVDF
jgi:soluble lytic murein transglycosylase